MMQSDLRQMSARAPLHWGNLDGLATSAVCIASRRVEFSAADYYDVGGKRYVKAGAFRHGAWRRRRRSGPGYIYG